MKSMSSQSERKHTRRVWTILAIAAVMTMALLWPARNVLREILFPENAYYSADTRTDLPERFHDWVPPNATSIRLRTYQSAWWITVESNCSESDAVAWAISIQHPLDSEGNVPQLPDHSLPPEQLGFISVPTDHERYLWHAGQGGRVSNLVYDRESETLYLLQSRI